MLTNIIRLWRSAQSCRRDEEKPLRVLGCSDLWVLSDLSGQILFFLYYPPHKFSNTSKTLYLYISCRSRFWKNQNPPSRRARPVPRRRGRSTRNVWKFSAGKTGRVINGTTLIWIVENCGKESFEFGGMRDILLFSFASLSRPSVSFIRAKMRAICQGNAFERNDSIFSCGAIESGRDREMKVWSTF
jgi:hypothetical protein